MKSDVPGRPMAWKWLTGRHGEPVLIMRGTAHPDLLPFYDIDHHLRRMASAGVDMHVVWQSSRPNVFWADPQLGLALCQIHQR